MTRTAANKKGRVFTAELKSKRALKSISLDNGTQDGVLIEGTLGTLIGARIQDGIVLEVIGTQGILRVDLKIEEAMGTPNSADVARRAVGFVNGGRRQ
ncbi:MAG: hypothetical protein E4H25_07915 [Methanomassiliicoccus sp.]|nr:MAG: hypothetical protein E4H25_07915 [Methanomassiliicoccus sp.]